MKMQKNARLLIFCHDTLMVPAAWLGAFWLRFNLASIPDEYLTYAWHYLFLVMLVQGIFYLYFNLQGGLWRFSSIPDLAHILQAVLSATLVTTLALFLYNRLDYLPRSVPLLYGILLILLLSSSRLLYRCLASRFRSPTSGKRTLIIGAGHAGMRLAKEILEDRSSGFKPLCFVDDDRRKFKRKIHGLQVTGFIEDLPELVKAKKIEQMLIAVPSASAEQKQHIISRCQQSGVPFKILPAHTGLFNTSIDLQSLRDVSIDELLGREPVSLDWPLMESALRNTRVLISGGGGSIGAELSRQIAALRPAHLIIFDQSEYNLYQIDLELERLFPDVKRSAILGDVKNLQIVRQTLETTKPEIIFHAAAYKHVPLLENQVTQAVENNIISTRVLAEQAITSGVNRFILISTDKAVNPRNIMGATKRVAEILCRQLHCRNRTRFMTVRFGNVLDSAGSVVPLFKNQIKCGGPVTVTHPEITRYFMTIPEACQLIMQAAAVGNGGETFVLDMGKPIAIKDLAEQMIRLSGKKPGVDIPIEYIGLRPGEKLHEELFYEQENLTGTGHAKLKLSRQDSIKRIIWPGQLDALITACQQNDRTLIVRAIQNLVPEFNPLAPATDMERSQSASDTTDKKPEAGYALA